MKYSPERREAILAKLEAPYNRTVNDLAGEEGISAATIYNWRKQARSTGRLLPNASPTTEGWSSAQKFNAVLETAALTEEELSEYCRRRGLYPEQIRRWRASCEQANDRSDQAAARQSEATKAERKRIRELERELRRKDAALAETAALLALRKKVQAIWGTRKNDQCHRSPSDCRVGQPSQSGRCAPASCLWRAGNRAEHLPALVGRW